MVSRQEVMSMLRRNADYNDRVGSTLGSGYIGGCDGCGESCMHCGSGYIGGFKGERLVVGKKVPRKAYRSSKAHQAAVRKYLETVEAVSDLSPYGVTPQAAILDLERRRAERIAMNSIKTEEKCSGMPPGLEAFCKFRDQNPGLSRSELSIAWAKRKAAKDPMSLSKKQKQMLGLGFRY